MLLTFTVLDALALVCVSIAGITRNADQPGPGPLMWLALDGFLAWRIWRHRSSGARDTLLGFRMLFLLLILIPAIWLPLPPLPLFIGALAIVGAQTVLLGSPALRDHVRAKPSGSRPSDDQLPSAEPPR